LQCKMTFLGSGVDSGSAGASPMSNSTKSTSYSLTDVAIDEVKLSDLVNSNFNIYLDNTDYSNFRAVIWDYVSMSILSLNPEQSPKLNIDCGFDLSIVSKLDKFMKFDVETPQIPINYQHTLDFPRDLANLLYEKMSPSEAFKNDGVFSFSSSSSTASSSTMSSSTSPQNNNNINNTVHLRPSFKFNSTNPIVQMINEYCGHVTLSSHPIVFGFNMSKIKQYTFTTESIFLDSAKDSSIYYNSTLNEKYVENSLFVAGSLLNDGGVTTDAAFGSNGFLEKIVGSHR
jgi:hypothetical protein